jgi:hypothetical protein
MIKKVAMNEKGYSMGPTRILTDLLGKWTEKKFCQDKIKRESVKYLFNYEKKV